MRPSVAKKSQVSNSNSKFGKLNSNTRLTCKHSCCTSSAYFLFSSKVKSLMPRKSCQATTRSQSLVPSFISGSADFRNYSTPKSVSGRKRSLRSKLTEMWSSSRISTWMSACIRNEAITTASSATKCSSERASKVKTGVTTSTSRRCRQREILILSESDFVSCRFHAVL